MSTSDHVVLAHTGELDGVRPYEELQSPFEAPRIVLLPLCAERILPEKIIPPLRLSLASAKSSVVFVPILEKKLAPTCKPGWTGSYPCARCALDRFRELLGAQNPEIGSPTLERLESNEEVESRDATILRFVRENPPPFAFVTDSPEAVPLAWFKHSRKPAAMWFADVLLVQSRRRVPSADDIEALLAMKPPPRPSVEQAARARYKGTDLLTVEEAAGYLHMKPGTLRNKISRGEVPYTEVGGRKAFLFRKLREWLESRTHEPPHEDESDGAAHPDGTFPWQK